MSKSEKSSGNVFADLGIENTEEELAKAKMAYAITQIIRKRGLTQIQAADLLGTDQARISDIANAKIGSMSFDRLIRFLHTLDYAVRFEIVPVAQIEEGQRAVAISTSTVSGEPPISFASR